MLSEGWARPSRPGLAGASELSRFRNVQRRLRFANHDVSRNANGLIVSRLMSTGRLDGLTC